MYDICTQTKRESGKYWLLTIVYIVSKGEKQQQIPLYLFYAITILIESNLNSLWFHKIRKMPRNTIICFRFQHTFYFSSKLTSNESFYQIINNVKEQLGISRQPGINSVPQIFFNNERVGGYSELIKLQDTGYRIFSQDYCHFIRLYVVLLPPQPSLLG